MPAATSFQATRPSFQLPHHDAGLDCAESAKSGSSQPYIVYSQNGGGDKEVKDKEGKVMALNAS